MSELQRMPPEEVVERLRVALPEGALEEARIKEPIYALVRVRRDAWRKALETAKELGFFHVTTISGIDTGDGIEVAYHLRRDVTMEGKSYGGATHLRLSTKVPYDDAKLPTATDLYPSAGLYEREVQDLLGVRFEGHPEPERLVLPEIWPEGMHPLLKRHSLEEVLETIRKVEEELAKQKQAGGTP